MTATSSEVERESASHEGTIGYVPNSSSSESAPPTIISPPPPRASSMQPHVPRTRVPQLKVSTRAPSVTFQDTDNSSRYLLPPRVFMPGPESPNSLPPVTPASLTSAPAIYSPMPITPLEDARLAYLAERVSSPRAHSPISQAKAAARTRQTQPAASPYEQSFSPWSFVYSPTVPDDARSPVAVHSVRVSPTSAPVSAPVSAPMSEIDLVKRPPPPAGQASQAHPVLKRVNTLRDLLGDEIMESVSRRGTPVEDGKPHTTEVIYLFVASTEQTNAHRSTSGVPLSDHVNTTTSSYRARCAVPLVQHIFDKNFARVRLAVPPQSRPPAGGHLWIGSRSKLGQPLVEPRLPAQFLSPYTLP
jgi:hypothetical protein